jgi:hypothetical protein
MFLWNTHARVIVQLQKFLWYFIFQGQRFQIFGTQQVLSIYPFICLLGFWVFKESVRIRHRHFCLSIFIKVSINNITPWSKIYRVFYLGFTVNFRISLWLLLIQTLVIKWDLKFKLPTGQLDLWWRLRKWLAAIFHFSFLFTRRILRKLNLRFLTARLLIWLRIWFEFIFIIYAFIFNLLFSNQFLFLLKIYR